MARPVIRSRAPHQRTTTLAKEVPQLRGPCIACAECHGICEELIETLTLPDAILAKRKPARKDRADE